MRTEWGRDERTDWPSSKPVYTIALLILSVAAGAGVECVRYLRVWTPLERQYLPAYVGTEIGGIVRRNGWYTLLEVVTRKGSRLALDNEAVPVVTDNGEKTFALTSEAVKQGALRLEWHRALYDNAQLHAFLGYWIYHDQTLFDLARPALWTMPIVFLVGLLPATWLERGDVILFPCDGRMPFWSIGDEVRNPAEASALAVSLFPDRPNQDPFFAETPRKIFAHLLTYKPTAQQLIHWMSHPVEIDRLVAGTPYATMINPQSPDQRNGVLGSLNRVADALSLLPAENEANGCWNTVEWSKTRTRWLFFPSTNMTRDRLMPLVSLWFDLLVMRTQDEGVEDEERKLRRVWFILDEVALLQKLPKLHDAVTRNRKTNNPIVLGFQGRSQLQKHYGLDAEVMFSQPGTKVFLRTSEPESAKWVSETIGEVEIEQVRESRTREQSPRYRHSRSDQLERRIEPLVLPSQIMGLEDRRGYVKFGNAVVQLSFPYVKVPKTQPAIIERLTEALPSQPPRAAAAVAGAAGSAKLNGMRQETNGAEQKPRQEQTLEHAVTPRKRRLFE